MLPIRKGTQINKYMWKKKKPNHSVVILLLGKALFPLPLCSLIDFRCRWVESHCKGTSLVSMRSHRASQNDVLWSQMERKWLWSTGRHKHAVFPSDCVVFSETLPVISKESSFVFSDFFFFFSFFDVTTKSFSGLSIKYMEELWFMAKTFQDYLL